jgi:hypothetical protein
LSHARFSNRVARACFFDPADTALAWVASPPSLLHELGQAFPAMGDWVFSLGNHGRDCIEVFFVFQRTDLRQMINYESLAVTWLRKDACMQNFKIVEYRNAQGVFIGWGGHPIERLPQAHIYPLYEMAEAVAIPQSDGEAVLLYPSADYQKCRDNFTI